MKTKAELEQMEKTRKEQAEKINEAEVAETAAAITRKLEGRVLKDLRGGGDEPHGINVKTEMQRFPTADGKDLLRAAVEAIIGKSGWSATWSKDNELLDISSGATVESE